MAKLRPETWVPGVAPSLSPGALKASALSGLKRPAPPTAWHAPPTACPAHCMTCPAHLWQEQMDVKMHLTIPIRHHRVLHLGTIGISSWMTLCCRAVGLGVVECLRLNASDITKLWQPEMCQMPLEVTDYLRLTGFVLPHTALRSYCPSRGLFWPAKK